MASGIPKGYPDRQWDHPHSPHSIPNKLTPAFAHKIVNNQASLNDILSNQFFLGFQDQIHRWSTLPMKQSTFPPYNLIKVDHDYYTLELALAGYSKEDVEVTVEKDLLIVKSVEKVEKTSSEVLHQGIAKRLWSQRFVLGEHMVVTEATLKDGLLTITVERELPEELKPKTIEIK
jgi:HSP20 family molecular chaperone IbpA